MTSWPSRDHSRAQLYGRCDAIAFCGGKKTVVINIFTLRAYRRALRYANNLGRLFARIGTQSYDRGVKANAPKIITVVGARPQFVKAAPVSRALKNVGIDETIIHTGQHSDANMSDVFFEELKIPRPSYFLGISALTHGAMTGEMIKRIEELLLRENPDAVLVYGDTNSTLAGALAAAKLNIPIAHVEAGLRSFNMRMPEEINRTLTDRISKWLFCPTGSAVQNLKAEGFNTPNFRIENVGDVMLDAALHFRKDARWPKSVSAELQDMPFILCTIHRQESVDDPGALQHILLALEEIAESTPIVWPVHPRARKMMQQLGLKAPKLNLIEPVGYLEMLALLAACSIVATDSGGLQKEAYFAGKHCLVLRTETEWVELVKIGANTICGTSRDSILRSYHSHRSATQNPNLYGDGTAAKKISERLKSDLA
ncbi:UDP-N-acetylglucosamine 2-epimerase (non-hydrolyzing) [soil metagenome]